MGKKRGLWIDHRVAKIVTLEGDTSTLEEIMSNLEKRVRASGGSRSATPYGPQAIVA